jgi:hypothetical protein
MPRRELVARRPPASLSRRDIVRMRKPRKTSERAENSQIWVMAIGTTNMRTD